MLGAPLLGALEAGVGLVFAARQDVEIDVLDVHVDVFVNHHLVDIFDGADHIHALLGRVHHLGTRLVFEDVIAVLHGHDEPVAQLLGPLEQQHMAYVEHIVYSKRKDCLHCLSIMVGHISKMPPEEPTSSGEFSSKFSAKFAGDPRDLPLQPVCGQQSQPAENNWHCLI